jgi:hypothetical protein
MGGFRLRPLVLSALLLTGLPVLAHAQVPAPADTVPEEALLELRLGRYVARTLSAWRIGEDALIPLTQFLDLAEIRAEVGSDGVLRGELAPGHRPFLVDPATHVATAGDRTLALASREILRQPAEIFLSARRLGELFGLDVEVDWGGLEVTVRDPESLPVAERMDREAARSALARTGDRPEPDLVLGMPRPPLGGFVLDYSVYSPSNNVLGGATYSVAAGGEVGGGSLELGIQSDGPAESGDVRLDASWLGVFRNQRWLRQVRIGDGIGSGVNPHAIRGLYVTNAPYIRPSLVADIAYAGQLPPGWQLEAYRNGVLVGVDSVRADGRYSVDLPVLYGDNPVDFVAYGPYGERREFTRGYLVPSALLEPGAVEYGLSAGACRVDSCRATANAEVRTGLSRSWTLGAGVDRFWFDSTAATSNPYLAALGTIAGEWTAEANLVAHGFARARLSYERGTAVRIGSEVTLFDGGSAGTLLNPLRRQRQVLVNAFWRPDRALSSTYVDTRLDYSTAGGMSTVNARTGISVGVSGLRTVPYVRLQRQSVGGAALNSVFVGFDAYASPGGSWGSFFRQVWLRGSYESQGLGRPQLISASVARPISGALRLETGLSWIKGSGRPAWTLSLTTSLPQLRAYSQVTAPSTGSMAASQMVQGSMVYDGGMGGMSFEAGPSVQRGGVGGRVFLDRNGNGKMDDGEPGLGNVRIEAGQNSAFSDSLGYYRVWDVVPFEPTLVSVDSLSFESPLWVPAFETALVQPAPNMVTRLDIPLRLGAVLEGDVVRDGTGDALAGVSLVLLERATSRRKTMATFSDGSFYALGITPGTWELRVAPATLKLLDADADPVEFTVEPGATEAPRITLRLRSRP